MGGYQLWIHRQTQLVNPAVTLYMKLNAGTLWFPVAVARESIAEFGSAGTFDELLSFTIWSLPRFSAVAEDQKHEYVWGFSWCGIP